MALKFGKSEGEIWMERLTAGLISGVILLAHAVGYLTLNHKASHNLAAALAPFWCWFVWQAVSRTATGAGFSLRWFTEDKTAREIWDIIFTCCFVLNTAIFLYFALGFV